MFALIPGFRKNPDAPTSVINLADLSQESDTLTVHLRPSRRLWFVQRLVHGLLGVSLSFALVPHISEQPLWLILWFVGIAGLWISLRTCHRSWCSVAQVLCIARRGWLLHDGVAQREICLSDDAVVFPWLVLLPCRDKNNRARIYLTILPDSTSPEEYRRLRVWLRTRR